MLFSMEIEEYMESEFSAIFPVKLVTKTLAIRSPGPNTDLFLQSDVPF